MSEQGYQPHPLRNVVAGHVGGGTPSRQVPSYWGGQIPWASVKDFPEQSGVIEDTEEHISTSGLNASASNLIAEGTPLVCTRMAVGRAAMPSVPMAINQDVKALFPASGVSPVYLLKLLQFIQPKAEAQAVGSTVKGIRIQDYLDIKVPIADSEAQPVIARVLDTLDTAIQQTEAIIAKLKAVKQGLLHDLLTRGIAANGELRPPQAEAPHLYKQSPLGWIPKEWEVRSAESVCEAVIDCKNRTPPIVDSGHPVVRTPNVRDGGFIYTGLVLTDEVSYKIWTQRGRPRPGDVLITREAPVGEVCLIPADMKGACLGQRMMMYRPDPTLLRSDFMLIALMSQPVQRVLIDKAGGSTVGHVRVGDIRLLTVPVPPVPEQVFIAKKYQAAVDRLSAEENTLVKLRDSKVGLMDDLLTGRVRVTPLMEVTI